MNVKRDMRGPRRVPRHEATNNKKEAAARHAHEALLVKNRRHPPGTAPPEE